MLKLKIKHSKPTILRKDKLKIKKILDELVETGKFAESKYTEMFEKKLCRFFESKYAVCVSSGTVALYLALLSIGVRETDEVIIPSYCCPAVLQCILHARAIPKIVDVKIDDFGISFKEVKRNITKKTKAIIVPHMFGYPSVDITKIIKLGVPVIEDTTQSLGAEIGEKMVGNFGDINVISFSATKMFTTFGEGGAVLTNNKEIYRFIKDIKSYDKKNEFSVRYNFKLTEIQSAMGLLQLSSLNEFINIRRKIFKYYKNNLKSCKNIVLSNVEKYVKPVYYRFIVRLNSTMSLEKCINLYNKYGIEVKKPVFLPLDKYFYGKFICRNSKTLFYGTLSLPIYPALTKSELDYIIEITKKIFG
ncbi:MAG: DegT/DnrJ/EryC1/StrS family aminotransferase [Endomicrobia bacterium]|nr:DegT/DnrJ/EryC1/StrS family aminotransferase [Endomicrobiia bacterium]